MTPSKNLNVHVFLMWALTSCFDVFWRISLTFWFGIEYVGPMILVSKIQETAE